MKPFLLIGTRADDAVADNEAAAFRRFGGLTEDQLHRVRLEQGPLPHLDLDDFSAVVVGGSPFCTSDPEESKSAVQRRVERELGGLVDEVVARDFPFLGACYGIGTLGVRTGGVVDRTYGEPVSAVPVTLTDAGRADPVLGALPTTFDAFVGHKEALRVPPPGAVVLAGSPACPVQAFRLGENLYATQFHPELDEDGVVERVRVYRDQGYFPASDVDRVVEGLRRSAVEHPPRLLAAFVRRYARD